MGEHTRTSPRLKWCGTPGARYVPVRQTHNPGCLHRPRPARAGLRLRGRVTRTRSSASARRDATNRRLPRRGQRRLGPGDGADPPIHGLGWRQPSLGEHWPPPPADCEDEHTSGVVPTCRWVRDWFERIGRPHDYDGGRLGSAEGIPAGGSGGHGGGCGPCGRAATSPRTHPVGGPCPRTPGREQARLSTSDDDQARGGFGFRRTSWGHRRSPDVPAPPGPSLPFRPRLRGSDKYHRWPERSRRRPSGS